MTPEEKWLLKYYQGAIGFKIVGVGMTEDGFPQLILEKGKGKTREEIVLEVSCDEEGNGAGFLFGLPLPAPINDRGTLLPLEANGTE